MRLLTSIAFLFSWQCLAAEESNPTKEPDARVTTALKQLESKPDDPVANAWAGRYLCLFEHNWAKGLPMLAKSTLPSFRTIAAAELDPPADAHATVGVFSDEWGHVGQTALACLCLLECAR